ncbi:MMPL family transporter [Streptomyces capillispiralis]|uniref:RND superfamily putative drug exporter n=1 Tax=Streptomyces capillispiralis TaxID=68182 RepID=A0A561T9W4_9ACTN|nr:MMPL family transporter [Streptomyces capillispiralis]TWF83907.1 RND superfamily putative drug exporter [Streptomyces capillispiralis]GHH95100.1 putative membrane protein [Streptomyces capillispiralis]
MLSALARAATRRPLTVMLLWGLFLLLGFGLGTGVFARLSDNVPEVPGTESESAAQYLDRVDPAGESISGVVAGTAVADPGLRAEVERAVADVREVPGVAAVPDPYTTPGLTAEDGRALLIPVTLEGGLDDDAEERTLDAAAERIREIDAPDVHVSGGPLLGQQLGERAQEDVKNAELISLPVVLALLLAVFGGLRSALLPLVIAVSGIAGAFLALFAFSGVTDISVYAIQVTTMLGLGLAVDYALLMLVRFREERRHTEDVVEAVHRTVAAAGRTVLFSGLTVAVSLTGLLVFPSVFLRSMGLAVAAVVVIDMLAALTLLPALLARFGGRIAPAKTRPGGEEGRSFARVARFAARRRIAVLAVVVPALLVLALPVSGMSIAVGDARQLPTDTEARQVHDTVGAHFPAGTGVSPVTVVVGPGADAATAGRIEALSPATTGRELPGGATVLEIRPPGPADGKEATELVERVRELRGDEPVEVTGTAARLVDFREMLAERGPWAALTVLAGIFVLLFAFTGSVLLPLRTIATTVLSLAAALGVVVWVFQDGHLAGLLGAEGLGALSLTAPPLIIAIAFGLAMDYELFILARMREARRLTGDDREAVVTGLRRSGRVVTCAALLLAVVFGAFMTGGFSPILQIGLGLTLAVLIDATVVRMLLVPATMALLGRRAWWAPAPLRRAHDRFGLHEEPVEQPRPRVPTGV